MIVQRLVRLPPVLTYRYFRRVNFNNWKRCYSLMNELKLNTLVFSHFNKLGPIKLRSTSPISNFEELVDVNTFEKVCAETLESLTEFFEELFENKDALKNADVSYSSGVLTINLGNRLGTYVINRQSPNRQIWLSSPKSGPKRYDYVVDGEYWVYRHDMVPLHTLLQNEFSEILGEKIDFSKCLYSKI